MCQKLPSRSSSSSQMMTMSSTVAPSRPQQIVGALRYKSRSLYEPSLQHLFIGAQRRLAGALPGEAGADALAQPLAPLGVAGVVVPGGADGGADRLLVAGVAVVGVVFEVLHLVAG